MSDGHDGYFDDAVILSMCIAFDRTRKSLQDWAVDATVQEIAATRIIEVALQGERDPDQLHYEAVKAFDIPKSAAA